MIRLFHISAFMVPDQLLLSGTQYFSTPISTIDNIRQLDIKGLSVNLSNGATANVSLIKMECEVVSDVCIYGCRPVTLSTKYTPRISTLGKLCQLDTTGTCINQSNRVNIRDQCVVEKVWSRKYCKRFLP